MRMAAKVLLMRGNRMDGTTNGNGSAQGNAPGNQANGDGNGRMEMRNYPRHEDGTFAPRSEQYGRMEMRDNPNMNGGMNTYSRNEMYSPRSEYRNDYRSEYRMERPDEMRQREYPMERPMSHKDEIGFKSGKHEKGHAGGMSKQMDEATAMEWVDMMQNEDGSKGEHFPFDKSEQIMKQVSARCDPLEFYVILNAVYSDYCKVAKKFGMDRSDFYGELAKAWLMDKDAEEGKAMLYYECIVKKN